MGWHGLAWVDVGSDRFGGDMVNGVIKRETAG